MAIPVSSVTLAQINNHSFCIQLVPETIFTAKQKGKSAQKQLLAPSSPLSVASFAIATAIRRKVYGDKAAREPFELFILYRKVLI